MSLVNRKVTYRLYPSKSQAKKLLAIHRLHQQLYNDALFQRIFAWRRRGISVSYADQCRELTELRAAFPEYAALNAQACQVTLKRLALAFQNFFRRVKAGLSQVGFPRFKALKRFSGWGYKTHGDGWKWHPGDQLKHGYLKLSGVGFIRMRGQSRNEGTPKTLEIVYRDGKWYASVTLRCEPIRSRGTERIGLDWGLETLLTLVNEWGEVTEEANPRYLKKQLDKLRQLSRDLSRKVKGSQNWHKALKALKYLHRRLAHRRHNDLHQLTARLIHTVALIATEELNIKAMTAQGGPRKKGLNREILSTSPGQLLQMLRTKAEEAGVAWHEVPTRKVKPTQRCHGCWKVEKKELSQREHICACGVHCSRDVNAARVMLKWVLQEIYGISLEWAECGAGALVSAAKHETPPIPALAGWRE